MNNQINPEFIEKAKAAKSIEELIAIAKEYEIVLTEDEAKELSNMLNGELSDEELDGVSGGAVLSVGRFLLDRSKLMRNTASLNSIDASSVIMAKPHKRLL